MSFFDICVNLLGYFISPLFTFMISFLPDWYTGEELLNMLDISDYVKTGLGWANYFLGLGNLISILSIWLVALISYFSLQKFWSLVKSFFSLF